MQGLNDRHIGVRTTVTLAIATLGAVLAWLGSAPVFILLGPAVAVSLSGLAGLRVEIAPGLRDVCFVVLGVAVGSGFDRDALGAMIRWPLAVLFVVVLIWMMLLICRRVLVRQFGFDHRAALLAGSPGHLSFVVAYAQESGADVARVSIVQSVRLLCLSIVVPFVALWMGVDVNGAIAPQGEIMPLLTLLVVFATALLVARVIAHLRVPAALLLGAMLTSGVGHLTGWAPGVPPDWLVLPAYLVFGALIGTRFSGMTLKALAGGLAAGLTTTGIAAVLTVSGAIPVAWALGMPLAHVLVAFAPGGLETMIVMGVIIGVVPGFVAACHISRLLVLSVLLPAMLGRSKP
ncbi:AbrB family transcriptional regulator [Sulfitobacter aestuariivivens]|uniref:AbrB family transcriptional regulator n=1 Tax=Sulfitobacter aestuariivivens TaxID=2766981 RepID=A0A927HEI8_9RHOB|nr:AbrB family transcriptional regulator [Sulfitobacter aestuariivivens]MBD3663414.1 AbrB family transcriptional regulator [Sulfitobacter aestuariivivens]